LREARPAGSRAAGIEKAWNEIDENEVLPAAGRLAAAQLAQNPIRLMACRQELQQAIWRRDEVRSKHTRQLDELTAEIETLSTPMIAAKAQAWQADLAGLSAQRAVEVDEKFTDYAADRLRTMFRIKSNSDVIAQAREQLQAAIKQLRALSTSASLRGLCLHRGNRGAVKAA
jgi:hypothetical protein